MPLGLYIHIPFCHSSCPYCDFAFVVGKNHLATQYTDAVLSELKTRMQTLGSLFDTVYFGGGTPSAVPPKELARILHLIRHKISPDAELTVEANPNDHHHFSSLYQLGINRLSLGVQAFTDSALKALGRGHTASEAKNAFCKARKAGFENIGIDLIFGAPKQTRDEWAITLQQAIDLCPEHVSVYGLTIEPQTKFARRLQKGQLILPPETDQADMYLHAIDQLEHAGYEHYEISNFSRPGFASHHNRNYWDEHPYLGVGLSAHSFLNNYRSWNDPHLTTYMQRIGKTGQATIDKEKISSSQQFLERVMLGIRQRKGLSVEYLTHSKFQQQYTKLVNQQLLEQTDTHIRLTRKGLLVADLVCAELVKGI